MRSSKAQGCACGAKNWRKKLMGAKKQVDERPYQFIRRADIGHYKTKHFADGDRK